MKNLLLRIKSYLRIKKAKRHIGKMFEAFEYFDKKLCQHYRKPYYYSHFLGLFPECGNFKAFFDNIGGALQFIFDYMDKTRSNWQNIVEVKDGNFIYDNKSVKFVIETAKRDDYDHDMYITIKDITTVLNISISIEYGAEKLDGLEDCPVRDFETMAFRYIGNMIADALASIYIEQRTRREKVK